MSIEIDAIYSIDAYRQTPESVARQFAREYWDRPRELAWIREIKGETRFMVENGTRVYRVVYRPWVSGQRPAMYFISVVS